MIDSPGSPADVGPIRLVLATNPTPRTYLVKTDTEMYVGAHTYLNQSEARLQLGQKPGNHAVVKGLSFRQTNNEALHRIDAEMAGLRHNLTLTLWPNGRIDTVDNQPDRLAKLRQLRVG